MQGTYAGLFSGYRPSNGFPPASLSGKLLSIPQRPVQMIPVLGASPSLDISEPSPPPSSFPHFTSEGQSYLNSQIANAYSVLEAGDPDDSRKFPPLGSLKLSDGQVHTSGS